MVSFLLQLTFVNAWSLSSTASSNSEFHLWTKVLNTDFVHTCDQILCAGPQEYCVMLAGVAIYEYSAEDVNCNAVM